MCDNNYDNYIPEPNSKINSEEIYEYDLAFLNSIIYPRKNKNFTYEYREDLYKMKENTFLCKFILNNYNCNRKVCTFAHTLEEFNPVKCLNFHNCLNEKCFYIHNNQTKDELFNKIIERNRLEYEDKNFSIICKKFNNCKINGCTFAHNLKEYCPKNCIFGNRCKNKEKCFYSHYETKEKMFERITKLLFKR